MIRFTWDNAKNELNYKKHHVRFEEGRTVFHDEDALLLTDPDHSEEEDRFVILGMSSKMRVLLVCHCYREDDEEIRIISVRKPDSDERSTYFGRKQR